VTAALDQYLEVIRDNLRIDGPAQGEVIQELETHIEDGIQELKEAGLSEDEATSTCLRRLGSAKTIARQI
jgi:hypothetical protein